MIIASLSILLHTAQGTGARSGKGIQARSSANSLFLNDGEFGRHARFLKEVNKPKNITIDPNPAIHGMTTVRFTATAGASFYFSAANLSGSEILRKQNKVTEEKTAL
jgi:hypothetical protein